MADLLNVEHLSVSFFTPAGEAQAVRDVSFSLKAGEVLAIVGESGCGKSVLCKSILRLLPQTAKIKSGKIIETGTAEDIFYDPRHPYTWGLLRSLPALSRGKETLPSIPGMPPTLIDPPQGDAFAPRNEYALAIDYEEAPPMFRVSDTHYAATWLLDERAPKITPPVGGAR